MSKGQLFTGPLEVPARDPRGTEAGPREDTPGVPCDGLDLLIAGVSDSGVQEKEAWLSLRMPDHSYWGKVKGRTKPAPRVTELTNLPPSVQRAFVTRWALTLQMRVSEQDTQRQAALNLLKAITDYVAEAS